MSLAIAAANLPSLTLEMRFSELSNNDSSSPAAANAGAGSTPKLRAIPDSAIAGPTRSMSALPSDGDGLDAVIGDFNSFTHSARFRGEAT